MSPAINPTCPQSLSQVSAFPHACEYEHGASSILLSFLTGLCTTSPMSECLSPIAQCELVLWVEPSWPCREAALQRPSLMVPLPLSWAAEC